MVNLIIDTNIFISSFFFKGTVIKVFEKILLNKNQYKIVFSEKTLSELKEKFEQFCHKLPKSFNNEVFLKKILDISIFYSEIEILINDCKDKDDNMFLELALHLKYLKKETIIITGDKKHLLVLNPYKDIPIITPRNFLENY
jgi:uncharacterized protein